MIINKQSNRYTTFAPFFSIIVPLYNLEDKLHISINSVLTQKFTDFEVILVDDGSIDNTLNVCKFYSLLDSRVSYISKINGGLSDARNKGIKKANGEYLIFLDGDDLIEQNIIDKLADFVQTNKLLDLQIIPMNFQKSNNQQKKYFNITDKVKGIDFLTLQLKNRSMTMEVWRNVYKRSFLLNNSLFFKEKLIHEDEEWTPRVFILANFVLHFNDFLYTYIINENSIMSKKNVERNSLHMVKVYHHHKTNMLNLNKRINIQPSFLRLINDYSSVLLLNSFINLYYTESRIKLDFKTLNDFLFFINKIKFLLAYFFPKLLLVFILIKRRIRILKLKFLISCFFSLYLF
jgi:glycosyltransferase involved in cell wall biosynthesis